MASTFFTAPTKNFISKTLNGAISNSANAITLNNTTNMQSPGYIVIDRVDASGNVQATSLRETVYYTGISGSQLTGCVRSADGEGGVGLAHGDQAIVEQTFTEGMWNSLSTIVASGLDGSGYLLAINSPVSIAIGQFVGLSASTASIQQLQIKTLISASGASAIGFYPSAASGLVFTSQGPTIGPAWSAAGTQGLFPVFSFTGTVSGPTTILQTPLSLPASGSFAWFSVITRTQASTASVIIDINVNGSSIFATACRPLLPLGATFVSTASIATKSFGSGNRLSWDFKNGFITDLVIQGGTI